MDINKHIIMHLAYNPHSPSKQIAKETGLSETNASKHLNKLKTDNIIDYKTCPTREGKNYTGKCWHIIDDYATFNRVMYNFVLTDYMAKFLQSPYVQNLDIHGLKIDQLIIGAITDYLNVAEWMWKLFYQHPKLTDQLDAAIAADASDNSVAKLLSQYTQEISHQMEVIPRLVPLLSKLPQLYGGVISPDIRHNSSALSDIDRSELKAILEKTWKESFQKNELKTNQSLYNLPPHV